MNINMPSIHHWQLSCFICTSNHTLFVLQSIKLVQFFATPQTVAQQASPSFTVTWSLLKFMSIASLVLSNHLMLCCLLFLASKFPRIGVFSNESALQIKWPKVLEVQLQHQSFQLMFRVDFLQDWFVSSPCSPRDSQESCPVPQVESISSSMLNLLYSPTLTSIHDYWKNHTFDYTDLCRQSDVSAFKYVVYICHSFSYKEQASFNFMAAITIHSDFGAQENKSVTISTVSPSICHEVMGQDAMILVF